MQVIELLHFTSSEQKELLFNLMISCTLLLKARYFCHRKKEKEFHFD